MLAPGNIQPAGHSDHRVGPAASDFRFCWSSDGQLPRCRKAVDRHSSWPLGAATVFLPSLGFALLRVLRVVRILRPKPAAVMV